VCTKSFVCLVDIIDAQPMFVQWDTQNCSVCREKMFLQR